jgi:hypothetical protein
MTSADSESPVADEGGRDTDEGEEVLGLSFVAAVQPTAAGQPGHGALDHPAVPPEAV